MTSHSDTTSSLPLESANVGGNSSGGVVHCGPSIVLTELDRWFAPVAEQLRLVYHIKGLNTKNVMLAVSSATYAKQPIYVRALTQAEKNDGDGKVIETWDGTLSNDTCPAGELRETLCINPLYAPYTVTLFVPDTQYTTRGNFAVLYDHLLMKMAAWSPGDPPDRMADLDKWTRYRLNQLGFFGGPWAADQDDYQKNAVIRYKISHPHLYRVDYSQYDATVSHEMAGILARNDAPGRDAFIRVNADQQRSALRPGDVLTAFPSRDWPTTRGRRFLIYSEIAPNFNDELTTRTTAELSAEQRNEEVAELTSVMRSRLNRPLLPVDVEIHVRRKDGSHVFSPRAVGKARIRWSHGEPWEDLNLQYADRVAHRSYPGKYIAKCLKLEGGQRVHGRSNNCPEQYGGIRKNAFDNWDTPFLGMYDTLHKDADYVWPYCFSYTYTGTDYPDRVGKAGVYFRPSKIAGDQYELVAYVDFRGRGNRFDLEDAHKPLPIMTQSYPFQNRRKASFAAMVLWPPREARQVRFVDLGTMGMPTIAWTIPALNVGAWQRIVAEFAAAYIDLDPPARTVSIAKVIGNSDFVNIVGSRAGDSTPFQAASLRSDGVLRLKDEKFPQLINTILAIGGVWGAIQDPLAALITRKVHIDLAQTGDLILVDHLVVERTRLRGTLGEDPTELRDFVEVVGSEGMGNGLAFVSQGYHAPPFSQSRTRSGTASGFATGKTQASRSQRITTATTTVA